MGILRTLCDRREEMLPNARRRPDANSPGYLNAIVGQMFDGTVQPLIAGFTVFGALTIAATLWAEKGKLFTHPGDSPQLEPGMGHV